MERSIDPSSGLFPADGNIDLKYRIDTGYASKGVDINIVGTPFHVVGLVRDRWVTNGVIHGGKMRAGRCRCPTAGDVPVGIDESQARQRGVDVGNVAIPGGNGPNSGGSGHRVNVAIAGGNGPGPGPTCRGGDVRGRGEEGRVGAAGVAHDLKFYLVTADVSLNDSVSVHPDHLVPVRLLDSVEVRIGHVVPGVLFAPDHAASGTSTFIEHNNNRPGGPHGQMGGEVDVQPDVRDDYSVAVAGVPVVVKPLGQVARNGGGGKLGISGS